MPARILIVEDEQIIAADLRNKLQRLGHQVIGMAIGGEEAITMADQFQPDLVLMDVQLEGAMSGTEAARTIQEVERGAGAGEAPITLAVEVSEDAVLVSQHPSIPIIRRSLRRQFSQ